jgi:hypothetical protein
MISTFIAAPAMADFVVNGNSVAASVSEKNPNIGLVLSLSIGREHVYIAELGYSYNMTVKVVNGTNVRFFTSAKKLQCSSEPSSKAGREFMLNELVTKTTITIDNTKFSANGFNAAVKVLKGQSNAL